MVGFVTSVGTGLGENCNLVHVPLNRRGYTGARVASYIDTQMRSEALLAGDSVYNKGLCPGCAMAVVLNALIRLSTDNGWPLGFIRDHMNQALDDLTERGFTRYDWETNHGAPWVDVNPSDIVGRRPPEAIKPPVDVDYTAPTAQDAVNRWRKSKNIPEITQLDAKNAYEQATGQPYEEEDLDTRP